MRNAKILLASLLVLGASACGFSESKFEKKSCEYVVDCFPELFADVDACLNADDSSTDTSNCEYHSDKAKECTDALDGLACDATYPSVCNDVYTNCGGASNNTSNTSNNMSNNASNNGSTM